MLIYLSTDGFHRKPVQFRKKEAQRVIKASKYLNESFLKSLCKSFLQALTAVGFTDSVSWLYFKSVMIDVSYHNYQETSDC